MATKAIYVKNATRRHLLNNILNIMNMRRSEIPPSVHVALQKFKQTSCDVERGFSTKRRSCASHKRVEKRRNKANGFHAKCENSCKITNIGGRNPRRTEKNSFLKVPILTVQLDPDVGLIHYEQPDFRHFCQKYQNLVNKLRSPIEKKLLGHSTCA